MFLTKNLLDFRSVLFLLISFLVNFVGFESFLILKKVLWGDVFLIPPFLLSFLLKKYQSIKCSIITTKHILSQYLFNVF